MRRLDAIVDPVDDRRERGLAIEVAKEGVVAARQELESLVRASGTFDQFDGCGAIGHQVAGAVHGKNGDVDLVVSVSQ